VQQENLDLWGETQNEAEVDFDNEGGETYICGNPPYQGSVNQTAQQKEDMNRVFKGVSQKYKDLDYVAAFMLQSARFNRIALSSSAFVTTNSITQGEQVAMLWPLIYAHNNHVHFAHTSFPWSNLASNKAVVTCVIIGLTTEEQRQKMLFAGEVVHQTTCISPYLVRGEEIIVEKQTRSIHSLTQMDYGNKPTDGGNLILSRLERDALVLRHPQAKIFIRQYIGSQEFIRSTLRYCLWIANESIELALSIHEIKERIEKVRDLRTKSRGKQANSKANTPHRFVYTPHKEGIALIIPRVTSEHRPYLSCGFVDSYTVVADSAAVIYDGNLVDLSILSWVCKVVCVKNGIAT
jgi:hypothetical protein